MRTRESEREREREENAVSGACGCCACVDEKGGRVLVTGRDVAHIRLTPIYTCRYCTVCTVLSFSRTVICRYICPFLAYAQPQRLLLAIADMNTIYDMKMLYSSISSCYFVSADIYE